MLKRQRSLGFRMRGATGSVLMVLAVLATCTATPLVREESISDLLTDSLAWFAFGAGAMFRWWCTLYVGGRKDSSVVCHGPYSVCRNPLYLGTVLLWISVALFLKSPAVLLASAAGMLFYVRLVVPDEERILTARLGSDYADYLSTVPRFFPKPMLFHTPPQVEVRVRGLAIEMRRCLRWFWIPFLTEILAHARMLDWWPHWHVWL